MDSTERWLQSQFIFPGEPKARAALARRLEAAGLTLAELDRIADFCDGAASRPEVVPAYLKSLLTRQDPHDVIVSLDAFRSRQRPAARRTDALPDHYNAGPPPTWSGLRKVD